jgi:hypothetical protein
VNRYDYAEAAAALRVEERWLRRNISRLPHSKKGRTVTFTDADLEQIDRMHHHEPLDGPVAPITPMPAAHPLRDLRPLGARRSA